MVSGPRYGAVRILRFYELTGFVEGVTMRLQDRQVPKARFGAWLLVAAFVGVPSLAQAANLEIGEATISTSTTFSAGTSIRASNQDCEYVSSFNGGCANSLGVSQGVNNDDGNINTSGWETISRVVKVTSEADISWRNFGAFVRGSAFFDFWADGHLAEGTSRFGRRPLKDALRGDDAQDAARSDFELLDAFVYSNFDLGPLPLSLRVGNQVVNWGESLFIPGGVNAFLPVDVAALRTPGSEIKEALKPQPSVYASVGLPYSLSLEGYYTFGFEKSDLDACGTFYAGHDGYCEGGAYVMLSGEFGGGGVTVPRTFDRDADDQGQFGIAMRYYADWLNGGTEMGVYFNRYHSKLPIATFTSAAPSLNMGAVTGNPALNGVNVTSARQFCGVLLGLVAQPNTFSNCSNPAFGAGLGLPFSILTAAIGANAATKESYAMFVEDIDAWGASFNTLVDVFGGTALAGEVSYTPNMPFQLADTEINANDLENSSLDDFAAGLPDGTLPNNLIVRDFGTIAVPGSDIRGYDEYASVTAQFQTTSTFPSSDPITSALGADTMIVLSNVGMQYLPDLRSNARLAAVRSGSGHTNALADSILGQGVGFTNYADDFSWGYRLVAVAQYNNAFNTSWTVSPSVQFGHDVKGHSAGPIGPGFVEHKKAVTLSVNAELESTWRVGFGYTNNFGARNYNDLNDKDFLSLNASYSF